jgi:hypothetical protein
LTHNNPSWNELILIAPDDVNSDVCNKGFACRKALFRPRYKSEHAQKVEATRNATVSFSFYSWLGISFEPRDSSRRQTKVDDYWVIQLKMGQTENGTFGRKKMNFVK